MALLGTIRNRFGALMMGMIFLAIGAFLFMDISPGAGAPSSGATTVGYVNGDKVSNELVQEYSRNFQGGQFLTEQIQEEVWNQIVREKLVGQKVAEAGIDVTADEMGDMFLSPDINRLSPTVRTYFGDRERGGAVNTEELKRRIDLFHNTAALLQQATTPREKEEMLTQQKQWINLEKSIKQERLETKYFDAIQAGVYIPTWMVEMEHKTQQAAYNFDYVRIPYTSITDKIEVTDSEITAYIAAHPKEFKREETASLEYITFLVSPTAKDSADYQLEMQGYAEGLAKATTIKEDSLAIARYYGTFPAEFMTKEELSEPQDIIDSLFKANEGTVFGPYLNDGKYIVLKKVEEKKLPDSVRARHILIRADNPQDGQQARLLLDSLKLVLETDKTASFDTLAANFSQDGSRDVGGDLGWKAKDGSFVPQFEEHMFYTGEKDSLKLLYTQFGVHLIQITGYQYKTNNVGIRIAKVERDIIPSTATTENKENEVIDFITNNRTTSEMRDAAKKMGLTINPVSSLEKGGYNIIGIGTNSTAAEIISWAHNPETQVNNVTVRPFLIENEELNYTDRFVVTALTSKTPKGLATFEDSKVKGDVDRILRNQKKVELIKGKTKAGTSLDAIAGEYSIIKETATNVSYASANIGTVGVEPKVVATAAKTEVGKISEVIGGKEGVYFIQVTSVVEAPAIANVKASRDQISNRIAQQLSLPTVFMHMKELSTIIDNRVVN